MKINLSHWTLRLLLLNATALLLTAGCATNKEGSYNNDFHQDLPTSPQYSIKLIDNSHFQVIVRQGSPYEGQQRVVYVKQAAAAVAENEARHRGWENWDLNYIQDRDQGWMHVVIADVTRKNAIEK